MPTLPTQLANLCGPRPGSSIHPSIRTRATLLLCFLASAVGGCDLFGPEPMPSAGGRPLPASQASSAAQVQALPPKGRDSVQVTAWGFRNLDRVAIDSLAARGTPPTAGANPALVSAWAAAGMRLVIIRPELWQQFVKSAEASSSEAADRAERIAEATADQLMAPDEAIVGVNSPRALIPGAQTWLTESPEWLEVHRGPGLEAGTVLAVADGRFAAPASVPRLLARAFRLGVVGGVQDADSAPEFVLELVPQLLEVRRANSDLDLVQPRLLGALERGLTLDRLLTSVRLRPGELLVLIPPLDEPTLASGSEATPADRLARAILGNPDSSVGKVRQGDAPLPSRSRSPGPSAELPGGSGGGQGLGVGPSATRPEEAGRAPTFGEVLLVGVGQGATRGSSGGKLSRLIAAEREEALRAKRERTNEGDPVGSDAASSKGNKTAGGQSPAGQTPSSRLTLRTLIVFQPIIGADPAVR